MRNKIFISHATPDDNDFTKWLSLKLIALGYEVWCDILELPKGIDFWKNIEQEIRQNAIKFIVVLSKMSNERQGVLNEIAAGLKVKKQLQDETFILPLIIDSELSYDDINIELVRLNAIDFIKSWHSGLQELLKALNKENVPKNSPDPEKSNLLYQQIFLQGHSIIEKDDTYVSNWFLIKFFPQELRFHDFDGLIPKHFDIKELTFPGIIYKNYLCTFAWEYDFIYQLPKTETYDSNRTIRIKTAELFSNTYNSDFISTGEAQRLIVQITNLAFTKRMFDKGLNPYVMSNKTAYYFQKNQLNKDKFNKIQFVGKQKLKNWHFGISAAAKLYPFHVLMVSSHIFFTENGVELIASTNVQHSARRRQGKNWWNDDWRSKLITFVQYLSDDDTSFFLEVGSEEKITVSNSPIEFHSRFSYNLPDNKVLEEESELSDLYDLDKLDLEQDENKSIEDE